VNEEKGEGEIFTVSLDTADSLGCTIVWCNHEEPCVGEVVAGSVALERGLSGGDRILEIDGVTTKGKSRRFLLPLIQKRPVQIKLQKRSKSPKHEAIAVDHNNTKGGSNSDVEAGCPTPDADDTTAPSVAEPMPSLWERGKAAKKAKKAAREAQEAEEAGENKPGAIANKVRFHTEGCDTQGKLVKHETDSVPSIGKHHGSSENVCHKTTTTGYYEKKKQELSIFDSAQNIDDTRHLVQEQRSEEIKVIFGRLAPKVQRWWDAWESIEEPPRSSGLARFIRSSKFETACVLVIIFNGVDIFMKTDDRMMNARRRLEDPIRTDHDDEIGFRIMELFFLVFYSMEMAMKLFVHRHYFFVNDQARWNNFEFALVLSSVFDLFMKSSANFTFLRSFRLLKVLRLVRALRFLKELRLMLTSMVGCLSPLLWATIMLVFLLSMFSIIFVTNVSDFLFKSPDLDTETRDQLIMLFPSVYGGILTLLEAVSGGADWAEGYNLLALVGMHAGLLYVFFILFFMISVWNVVTSLFIEKAMSTAQPDMSNLIYEQHMRDLKYSEELMSIIQALDTDHSGTISYQEFLSFFQNERYRAFFVARGIDIKDAQKFYQILSSIAGTEEVDCDSFVQGCMRMKGLASSLDVQTIRFECRLMHAFCKEQFKHIRKELTVVHHQLPSRSLAQKPWLHAVGAIHQMQKKD
jgi:hypothetical protein